MSLRDPWLDRRLLRRLVILGVAQAAAAIAVVLCVSALFGAALAGEAPAALPLIALGLAAAAAVWLTYRERVDGEALGQSAAHAVRKRLAGHLLRLPAGGRRPASGEVVLRFTGDLSALRNWYARGLAALFVSVPMAAGSVLGVGILDPRLALVLAAMLGLGLGLQWVVAPRLRAAAAEARRRRSRLAVDVAERADSLASVQLFGRSSAERRRLVRRSQDLAEAMLVRARWSGAIRASTEWVAAAMPLAIVLVWSLGGGTDAGTGAATLAITGLLGPRIREIARVREYHELAGISRERIEAFIATEALDERSGSRRMARRQGGLALKDLALKGVFGPLGATAEPGARVALAGPNGAGKSRLLGVIAGLEAPSGGRVVIDRQNATGRQLSSLRKVVALAAPGTTPLLRGDVRSNVFYGARATEDEAAEILDACGYDALLAELPDGERTRITAGGQGLSLGQQARVTLIRALLRRPLVLLLDEIDAHLDDAGQAMLDRVLDDFDGTVVMATHAERLIDRADVVWHLSENGIEPVADPVETRKLHA